MNKYCHEVGKSIMVLLYLPVIVAIVGCSTGKKIDTTPIFLRHLNEVILPEIILTDATLIDAVRAIREEWVQRTDFKLPLSEAYSNMTAIKEYKANVFLQNMSALAAINHLTNIYPCELRFFDNCILLENKTFSCEMGSHFFLDEYITERIAMESFPFAQKMELILKNAGCDFKRINIEVVIKDDGLGLFIIRGLIEDVEYAIGVIDLHKNGYIVEYKNIGHAIEKREIFSHLIKPSSAYDTNNKSAFTDCLDKIIIPEINLKNTDVLDAMNLICNRLENISQFKMPFYEVKISYEKPLKGRVITAQFFNISGLIAISYLAEYLNCEIQFPTEELNLLNLNRTGYDSFTFLVDERMLNRISPDGILSSKIVATFLKENGLPDINIENIEILPEYDMIFVWGSKKNVSLAKTILGITKRGYYIKKKAF